MNSQFFGEYACVPNLDLYFDIRSAYNLGKPTNLGVARKNISTMVYPPTL